MSDTPSSAASGMGLVEELRRRAYSSQSLVGKRFFTQVADALSAKDRELAEARAEIERLRRERDHWKFGHDASERARDEALSALRESKAALDLVRGIIVEAAMTGFNCHDGDWAERLYASQADTHAAVTKADAVLTPVSREQRGEEA